MPIRPAYRPVPTRAGFRARGVVVGLLLGLAGILIPQRSVAQDTIPSARHYARWFGTAQGLPGNFVRDIAQGADGRLWIVASGSLSRFDGRRFEPIAIELPDALPGARELAESIETAGGDSLWVGTFSRRLALRTQGVWTTVLRTNEIIADLAARPGLPPVHRTDGDSVRVWRLGARISAPPIRRASAAEQKALMLDAGGGIWALSEEPGLAVRFGGSGDGGEAGAATLEVATGRFVVTAGEALPLGVRRRGGMLEIIDPQGTVRRSIPDAPGRTPRLLTRDGRLVVTTPRMIELHKPESSVPELFPFPDPGEVVLSAFEDREGSIWLGTSAHGLVNLRRSPFRTLTPPPADQLTQQVRTFGAAAGGVLVVARRLYRVVGDRFEAVDIPGFPDEGFPLTAALEDSRGTLWISLTGDETARILARTPDGRTTEYAARWPVHEFLEEPASGTMIWLLQDRFCRVALGSAGASNPPSPPDCTALGNWLARDMHLAPDGTLWVAGAAGVWAGDWRGSGAGAAFAPRTFTPENGYALAGARAVYGDPEGKIWVGLYYGGLALLQGDSVGLVQEPDGLSEDVVSSILEDEAGTFWMSGNEGVHTASRAELEAFLRGERAWVSHLRYDHLEGLANPETSGWQAFKADDGRLWFPTFGGAAILNPEVLGRIRIAPAPVHIDFVRAGGALLPVSGTVPLPRGTRMLEVGFAAASLRAPEVERIEYRLAGHLKEWTEVRGDRTLTLRDLRPGRWLLEFRSMGTADLCMPSSASVTITVPALFHETPWFILLLVLGGGGVVYGVVALRTRLLQSRALELQELVAQQTRWLALERDRTADALDRAALTGDQLRGLIAAKARVFASLSHELRTPLSLIMGPLQDLERSESGAIPEAARTHLRTLRRAVGRLERLTGQFLDLSDSQAGALTLHPRVLDFATFLAREVEGARPVAQRRDVRLTLELPEPLPLNAEFDPDHLDKVISNLIGNAIKHSPPGSEVRIGLTRAHRGGDPVLVIEVADRGPGIDPALRERVFEPFFQGAGATEGMGLGLSLTRDVALLHHGGVEVVDTPAPGATVRFWMPRLREPDALASPEPRLPQGEPAHDPSAGEAPPLPRLLIVEDDADLLDYLAARFTPAFRVMVAESAEDALGQLRVVVPDLVVSDIVMPGIDGLELCRILKSDPATRAVPVILLTARGSQEDRLRGLSVGADEYIVKPFDPELLERKVGALLELNRSLEERFTGPRPAWSGILLRSGRTHLEPEDEEFLATLRDGVVAALGDPDLDAERLATLLGISRSSLYRRLKELLDCSPAQFVAELRLEEAAHRLRKGDDTVASIATQVGFRTPAHFSRRFQAHFGISPSAYRARPLGVLDGGQTR